VRRKNVYEEESYDYELQIVPTDHMTRNPATAAHVQFVKQDQGAARADLFTDRMEAYAKTVHKKWCNLKGVEVPLGRYHADFDRSSIQVKPRTLPEKPKRIEMSARQALLKHSGGIKLVSKGVQQRLAKLTRSEKSGLSSIVRESMARYKENISKPVKEVADEELDMSKIPLSLRNLPRATLLKLQGKSKVGQILKVDKETQKRKRMLEQLPELVRVIKVFFRSNRRTAMPFNVLVLKLGEKLKSNPSPEQIKKMIEELSKIVPEMCEIQAGVLKIFKLKSGFSPSEVFRKIKKAIQAIEL